MIDPTAPQGLGDEAAAYAAAASDSHAIAQAIADRYGVSIEAAATIALHSTLFGIAEAVSAAVADLTAPGRGGALGAIASLIGARR